MRGSGHRWLPQASEPATAAIVAAAGLSGFATVGSATGAPEIDRLLRGGLLAVVAAAALSAPTWAVVVLATGAATFGWTGGPLAATSGCAALLSAVVLVWKDIRGRHVLKAASAALAGTALLRVPGGPLAATAAITGALVAVVVLAALQHAPRQWRHRVVLGAAALFAVGALAAVLGGLAGLSARASFERSSSGVTSALAAARSGDGPRAAESARAASADLDRARASLRAWWARPGWAVPIVGAHLRAADGVASGAGPAIEAAAESADVLRLDALRPESGRLDLDRLAAADPPLDRLSGALHAAQRAAVEARSPWLVGPVQDRLERYDAELADITATTDRALLAVRALPDLLGRHRPTRWFVAVANPAETRELGGFTGEYVLLVATDGNLRVERSGSVEGISGSGDESSLRGLGLPARYLSQRPDLFWKNLTGYPDLPTVATATRALWDQAMPDSPIDGVAYIDPRGLAALLRLTGPIRGPGPLSTLTADNAAQLLLVDQYTRFGRNDERKDALQAVSSAAFTALSTSPLPAPAAIGAALGPAVRGGHLLATSFDPQGQRLLDEIGASGRLPVSDGGDLASLRTTNLGPNKLDAYVRRSVRYDAVVDPAAGRVEATATIELRSDATSDLPNYVAANDRGLPKGTDVLEVAWYSGLALEGIEVDGRPVPSLSDRERGWWTHAVTVQVPPGGATTVSLRLAGPLSATRPYRLAVAPQAAAHDDDYLIEVTAGSAGWSAGHVRQPRPGQTDEVVVELRRP